MLITFVQNVEIYICVICTKTATFFSKCLCKMTTNKILKMLDNPCKIVYNEYRKLRKEVIKMFKRLFNRKTQETAKTYKVRYNDGGDIVEDIITSTQFSNYMMGLDMVGAEVLNITEM